MIKHIVFFRLKEQQDQDLKKQQLLKLKNFLESLKEKIGWIVHLEAGINFSTREVAFDLALISDFKSVADLEKYIAHPEHQKLVEFLNEIKKEVAVVDYEY